MHLLPAIDNSMVYSFDQYGGCLSKDLSYYGRYISLSNRDNQIGRCFRYCPYTHDIRIAYSYSNKHGNAVIRQRSL